LLGKTTIHVNMSFFIIHVQKDIFDLLGATHIPYRHAILAFLHRGFRQSDDVEGGEPGVYIDFDLHLMCIDSALFPTEYRGDGHPCLLVERVIPSSDKSSLYAVLEGQRLG
jgi:hypothetical protein